MANPFAALITDSQENRKETQQQQTNNEMCKIIENCFGFTLDKIRSQKEGLVYLEEQANAFPNREIDLEILEHALFERLFLQNPESTTKKCNNNNNSNGEYYEICVIKYLFYCYTKSMEVKDDNLRMELNLLIMRNTLTALKQPELYDGQDLYNQFYDILKSCEQRVVQFFNEVCQAFLNDDEGVDGMREPYGNLLKLIHVDIVKSRITDVSPVIFHILQLFTSNENLCNIFMDYCKPSNADVGRNYADNILGALLSLSILPKTNNGTCEFFQNPLDPTSIQSTENLLFANVDKLLENIHHFMLSLIKCSPSIKGKVLNWFGGCLKANTDRGKIWNSQLPELNIPNANNTVSDGFMINLNCIFMRFCQPFCSTQTQRKVLKVDPTYCAINNEEAESKNVHLLNMSEETCLIPENDAEDGTEHDVIHTASTYNFVTECFFMGHRSIDLGFRVSVDKLVRLNQDMARLERAYNDALSQGGASNDLVDTLKERLSSELAKYLSLKATLSEPVLLELMFNFISASSYWLTQIASHANFNDNSQTFSPLDHVDFTFPIDLNNIPFTLKCIPEFLIENIVCYLVFLRRFNPKIFEVQGYDNLEHILTFILIYMGSPQHMKNPHLRARLAEGLESLLPFHKDDPAGLNAFGGYQRERLFKQHPHNREIVCSLLEVFVGIEMTGQSVQFEQKFNYRRPMYLVMDYLWELDEHQNYFLLLAKEAEQNMEAVSPPLFLRFVNLLMNDAVFLLDEALSNMSKLKEMQTARENGEWDRLSSQERAQNMGYFQQTGLLAKFDNILGRDTIKMLVKLTSKIAIVFTHSTMVDRVAAMLNYFLLNLVGPNQKNFKVKDQKEYNFEPAATVLDICKIYVNLKESDAFCLAVSQDGRSYKPQLFKLAEDVLVRIGGASLVGELEEVSNKVAEKAVEYRVNEELTAEAPEHFLDPIMSTFMLDPVILPSSKQTVDRTTIARHLLSDQTDPFNRSPLTMDQVVPNSELADEIKSWLAERKKR